MRPGGRGAEENGTNEKSPFLPHQRPANGRYQEDAALQDAPRSGLEKQREGSRTPQKSTGAGSCQASGSTQPATWSCSRPLPLTLHPCAHRPGLLLLGGAERRPASDTDLLNGSSLPPQVALWEGCHLLGHPCSEARSSSFRSEHIPALRTLLTCGVLGGGREPRRWESWSPGIKVPAPLLS